MDEIEDLQDMLDERDSTIEDLEYDKRALQQEVDDLSVQLLQGPDPIDLLKLDPDPYGYHGISLQTRMEAMKLCSPRQGLRLS